MQIPLDVVVAGAVQAKILGRASLLVNAGGRMAMLAVLMRIVLPRWGWLTWQR